MADEQDGNFPIVELTLSEAWGAIVDKHREFKWYGDTAHMRRHPKDAGPHYMLFTDTRQLSGPGDTVVTLLDVTKVETSAKEMVNTTLQEVRKTTREYVTASRRLVQHVATKPNLLSCTAATAESWVTGLSALKDVWIEAERNLGKALGDVDYWVEQTRTKGPGL